MRDSVTTNYEEPWNKCSNFLTKKKMLSTFIE